MKRPESKMSKSEYTLHYHRGVPGRGEFVRLAFEYTGTPYRDPKDPYNLLNEVAVTSHPPHLSPPILEVNGAFISQTPSILNYLAPILGLDGTVGLTDPEQIALRRAHVNQLVLTALDLNDEAHNTHHPVGVRLYFEDQVNEAKRKAEEVRTGRIPKYLGHFALAIESNVEGEGKHLIGSKMTTADLVLYHLVDGLMHAFPRRMATLKADPKYRKVFDLYDAVAADDNISAYLKSKRREPYGMGIFRHYPELDAE